MEPLSNEDTEKLLLYFTTKILKYLKKKVCLNQNGDIVENPMIDGLFRDHDSLTQATAPSIAGKIAFGPNAGRYATMIGSGFGNGEETPYVKGNG